MSKQKTDAEPTTSSHSVEADKPSVFDLISEREKTKERWDRADRILTELKTEEGVNFAETLAELENKYAELAPEEKLVTLETYVIDSGRLPAEYMRALDDYNDIVEEAIAVGDQLNALYGKELTDYTFERVLSLEGRIDHGLAAELTKNKTPAPTKDGLEKEWPREEFGLEGLIQQLGLIRSGLEYWSRQDAPSFEFAEQMLEQTEELEGMLSRWGVLDRKSAAEVSYDEEDRSKNAGRALLLNTVYRIGYEPPTNDFEETKSNYEKMPMYEWAIGLDEEAIESLVTHMKSVDIEKELTRIQFEGLEDLSFTLTEKELRDHLRDQIPPLAFEGLRTIEFRRKTPEQKALDKSSDLTGLAYHQHDPETNDAKIVVWTDPLEEAKGNTEYHVRQQFFESLDHEMGHALATVLPVEILDQWNAMTELHPERVTTYVAHRFDHRHPHRFAEDFADSFSLFRNDSAHLSEKSLARFMMMYEIIGMTMPDAERVKDVAKRVLTSEKTSDNLPEQG